MHYQRLRISVVGLAIILLGLFLPATTTAELPRFQPQEIANDLGVGYAVTLVDLSGDSRLDIVAVDQKRVLWFENPSQQGDPWTVHNLILDQTKPDNVAIAPYDIDGDGQVDFALGADWRPFDTRTGGTIQWLKSGVDARQRWTVHPIGEEPMVHRVRWADLDGDGRSELVVVPLVGRDSIGPTYDQTGVRVLAYKIPADPIRGPWVPEVVCDDLHVTHNFLPTDFDDDGRIDLLIVSFDGVHLLKRDANGQWTRTHLGAGNQQTSPHRGASEIKVGRLEDRTRYIATIEPWHGNQVVVYTPPTGQNPGGGTVVTNATLWNRHVLDEELKWGHAVWCANFDEDADEELVIGVRDTRDPQAKCGVRIYDPVDAGQGKWNRHLVDPGGVAAEDVAVADLDGDGRPEIVAVGRSSHNLRIYWNRRP